MLFSTIQRIPNELEWIRNLEQRLNSHTKLRSKVFKDNVIAYEQNFGKDMLTCKAFFANIHIKVAIESQNDKLLEEAVKYAASSLNVISLNLLLNYYGIVHGDWAACEGLLRNACSNQPGSHKILLNAVTWRTVITAALKWCEYGRAVHYMCQWAKYYVGEDRPKALLPCTKTLFVIVKIVLAKTNAIIDRNVLDDLHKMVNEVNKCTPVQASVWNMIN